MTSEISILKLVDADGEIQLDAIRVFVDSFYDLYKSISKDKNILTNFLINVFDLNFCYAAILNEKVVGFVAICTGKERSMKFDKSKCINIFGKIKGSMIFKQMSNNLGKPNLNSENDIAIDHLATHEKYRGKGIASYIIDYVCSNLCSDICFIDVASKNTKAKNLYEYLGFREYATEKSLAMRLVGLGHIVKMKKVLK